MPYHRNQIRPGKYLMIDDITGEEYWSDEIGKDWDGSYRYIGDMDGKHPDYEQRQYPMEKSPDIIAAPAPVTAYSSVRSDYVGNTTVSAADDYPGNHLF